MKLWYESSGRSPIRAIVRRSSRRSVKPVASSGKIDITKQGLNSIPEGTVKQNLMGRSRFMKQKGWTDSQGRKGKVRMQLCLLRAAALFAGLVCGGDPVLSMCAAHRGSAMCYLC